MSDQSMSEQPRDESHAHVHDDAVDPAREHRHDDSAAHTHEHGHEDAGAHSHEHSDHEHEHGPGFLARLFGAR